MPDPEGGFITLLAEAYKDNQILFETFKDELTEIGINALEFINAWNNPANNDAKEVMDVLTLPETSEKSRLNTTTKA